MTSKRRVARHPAVQAAHGGGPRAAQVVVPQEGRHHDHGASHEVSAPSLPAVCAWPAQQIHGKLQVVWLNFNMNLADNNQVTEFIDLCEPLPSTCLAMDLALC